MMSSNKSELRSGHGRLADCTIQGPMDEETVRVIIRRNDTTSSIFPSDPASDGQSPTNMLHLAAVPGDAERYCSHVDL